MEGRVEAGYVRHRRQEVTGRGETVEGLRLLQRREVYEVPQPLFHVVVDQNRLNEIAAAVDDSGPHGIDRWRFRRQAVV